MDTDTILLEAEEKMVKSLDHLQREVRGIRTGRASTALLEFIKVDYYGSMVDLRELAAISVPEPTQLLVKPFDPGAKLAIIKAIETSNLGLNPQSEGSQLRMNLPAPSSDRRRQLATQVRKMAEETRIAMRNERRDANKAIDTLVHDPKAKLSEDTATAAKESIDELIKQFTGKIDELADKKVKEIEEV